ncbi:unnamed protein product [Closterium sp. NIES-65]|nr:unnamed protein product [Closterium sp. NIES-65]
MASGDEIPPVVEDVSQIGRDASGTEAPSAEIADSAPLESADGISSTAGFEPAIGPDGADSGFAPADVPELAAVPEMAAEPTITHREFYFIRIPRPDLSAEINKIKAVEQRVKEKRDKQQAVSAALRAKKAQWSEAFEALKAARARARDCSQDVRNKFDEAKPLQGVLRKMNESKASVRDRGRGLECTTEAQLNALVSQSVSCIAATEHRMQHETISLKEEKQLMKELKDLEASRPKVKEMEALTASFQESQGQRDSIQERLKVTRALLRCATLTSHVRFASPPFTPASHPPTTPRLPPSTPPPFLPTVPTLPTLPTSLPPSASPSPIQPLMAEVDVLKLERDAAQKICATLEAEAAALDEEVQALFGERAKAQLDADKVYDELRAARAATNKKDEDFRQYRADLATIQELASKKDVAALEAFCEQQVRRGVQGLQRAAVVVRRTWRRIATAPSAASAHSTRAGSVVDEDPANLLDVPSRTYAPASAPAASAAGAGEARAGSGAEKKGKGAGEKETGKAAGGDKGAGGKGKGETAEGAGKGSRGAAAVAAAGGWGDEEVDVGKGKGEGKAGKENGVVMKVPETKVEEVDEEAERERRREEAIRKAKEAEARKAKLAEKAQKRAEARAAKEAEALAKRREKWKGEKRLAPSSSGGLEFAVAVLPIETYHSGMGSLLAHLTTTYHMLSSILTPLSPCPSPFYSPPLRPPTFSTCPLPSLSSPSPFPPVFPICPSIALQEREKRARKKAAAAGVPYEREKRARKKAAAAGVPYVEGAAEAPAEGEAPEDATTGDDASAAEETGAAANSKGDAGKGGEAEAGLSRREQRRRQALVALRKKKSGLLSGSALWGLAGILAVVLAIVIAYYVVSGAGNAD